ncbi:thioesterase II family protein [Streptomyces naphthomycinicus]|uniref:thioesterase II family protein n=1 Tax=Streptomyces naphthomycinicus TaxID=2872625 RepID=UPI001CEC8F25|nr:alpha/beta fold hydrolase [Streptomyces sp. TML10]
MRRTADAWLNRYRPVRAPRLRLVCFPHAGGAAGVFRRWTEELPPDVELVAVQYPGRQERFDEPCVEDMTTLADRITDALTSVLDRPVALFGHSMGAAVAYEVTRRLEARRLARPVHLFVSGAVSPLEPRQRRDLHLRDDDGMVEGLTELGGMDEAVLADAELLRLVLPCVRADLRLIETYRPAHLPSLATPVTAYTGTADAHVPREGAAAWRDLTSAEFNLRVFPGGHFYLIGQEPEVVGDVCTRLALR